MWLGYKCPTGVFEWVIYIPVVFSSMCRKKLTEAELQEIADNLGDISSLDESDSTSEKFSSEADPFHNSEDSDESYKPSDTSDENSQEESSERDEEELASAEDSNERDQAPAVNCNVIWSLPTNTHIPQLVFQMRLNVS